MLLVKLGVLKSFITFKKKNISIKSPFWKNFIFVKMRDREVKDN